MAKKLASKPQKVVSRPVATLVRKRSWIVPILIVVVIAVVIAIIYSVSVVKQSGTVLATVNGEPIYKEEIATEIARLPQEVQAEYSESLVLNQTIDKVLLLQEAKRRGITVTESEIDEQLTAITQQFGISQDQLEQVLANQSITLKEYRDLVREELTLSKVVHDAVVSRVAVSEKDIVSYYEEHADEFSAPVGGVLVAHILVADEQLAKDIIANLSRGEAFDTLAERYSLDKSTAADGGYLGIVSADTPYVEEFKNASLALKKGMYTKTPVKSSFGYHVILRFDTDTEPLRYVRSAIDNKLKLQKQIQLFQELLATLRSQATIKYFTDQGVVTQEPQGHSLNEFSACVHDKATLYGTSWSPFFQEQQAMFGDSFGSLNVVDCDEKPNLCSAANVQKYPTWVFADGERTGKLSLADISAKTGCALPE